MAILKHFEPLLLEYYVRIVALTPELRKVSFYRVTEFLKHRSTIEILLFLILIRGSYPSSKASLLCWSSLISLVAAVARKFIGRSPRGSVPRVKMTNYLWLALTDAHVP